MSLLPTIVTFWHGPLSYLERLCLTSFVEKGHTVEFYSYAQPEGLPAGVTYVSAEEIIPESQIFFYKGNRTPAVFADLFRLELLRQGRGIWVDCDVYCVKSYQDLPEYVYGFDSLPTWRNMFKANINNAVLGMPSNSKLLQDMLSIFEPGAVPPGLPFWRKAEVKLRRAMGEELPIHHMQFGATGPAPLAHFVRKNGLVDLTQSKDVFYPLDYDRAGYLLEEDSEIESFTKPNTLSIHIWNSALTDRHSKARRIPHRNSFIARELRRLNLDS